MDSMQCTILLVETQAEVISLKVDESDGGTFQFEILLFSKKNNFKTPIHDRDWASEFKILLA